jgi:hypothetical protein
MTDPPLKEHAPTQEDLEREARRLARVRHLTLVRDIGQAEREYFLPDPEPDPKAAA